MGSTLTVDNIVGATTAANVKLPAGATLQVVEATSSTDENVTSTSFVNSTITANITPKYNNSLIKIECLFHFHKKASENGGDVQLVRDVGGTITNLTGSGQDFYIRQYPTDAADTFYFPLMLFATDTPATTSARTYRLRIKATGSTGCEIFNNRGKGRMILMEIAQ